MISVLKSLSLLVSDKFFLFIIQPRHHTNQDYETILSVGCLKWVYGKKKQFTWTLCVAYFAVMSVRVVYTGHTNQDVIKHYVLDRKTIKLIPNHIFFERRTNVILVNNDDLLISAIKTMTMHMKKMVRTKRF